MPLVEDEQSHDSGSDLEPPRLYGSPRLVAVARDPRTIFVYWNVDWPSIFKNTAPVDRQVHLRLHCADGLEEKGAAVEPMARIHHVTMSQWHRTCRIEVGYYQPADVWHSVAMSNDVAMPSAEISDADQVDLASIPFHFSFQQLVDLFGTANEDALATVMSRFQTRALRNQRYENLSPEERRILRHTGVRLSELAAARHAFNQIDSEKLNKRAEALVRPGATSPSRGLMGEWASAGS